MIRDTARRLTRPLGRVGEPSPDTTQDVLLPLPLRVLASDRSSLILVRAIGKAKSRRSGSRSRGGGGGILDLECRAEERFQVAQVFDAAGARTGGVYSIVSHLAATQKKMIPISRRERTERLTTQPRTDPRLSLAQRPRLRGPTSS